MIRAKIDVFVEKGMFENESIVTFQTFSGKEIVFFADNSLLSEVSNGKGKLLVFADCSSNVPVDKFVTKILLQFPSIDHLDRWQDAWVSKS